MSPSAIGESGRIWPAHFGVVGLILVAALVLPFLAQQVARSEPFVELLSVQQGLQHEPGVRHATANIGVNKFVSISQGPTTTHIFSSRILLAERVTDLNSLANRLVRIILDRSPSAEKEDVIALSIVYGYDIGIASAWRSQNFSFSPAEWRRRSSTP